MSTVSYLRVQLRQAERRLAKFKAKRAELIVGMEGIDAPKYARRLMVFDVSDSYLSAQAAVTNLTAALNKEERRLAPDPTARL